MAFFPPTARDSDLERRAAHFHEELERLPFTIAMQSDGPSPGRHRFCFRVPGKGHRRTRGARLAARLWWQRGPGRDGALARLGLRPNHVAHLKLVLQDGRAALIGIDQGGRRRIQYLESDKGYTGVYEDLSLADAVGERVREAWRRFPIGVVMFVGLPFFIAAFWIGSLTGKSALPSSAKPGATSR
jgi:hypothetical protein